jgi:PAS domain S-box-containing protein
MNQDVCYMKTPQLLLRADSRSALLFFLLGTIWIMLTRLVVKQYLAVELGLMAVVTILVFLYVNISRKQLVRIQQEYKSLFDTHPSPMWIYDKNTLHFLAVNNAAIHHYGYSRKEFLAMTILDIRPPEDVEAVLSLHSDITGDPETNRIWRHLKKTGEEIGTRITGSDVRFNKKMARLIHITDVTQVLRQEKAIRQMSAIAENTSNGVILSDPTGRIQWVNKAFERTTGYTLEDVRGKFPRSFLHGADTDKDVEALIIELASQQKPFSGEILNYKKNGQPYWVHLNLTPVVKNGVTENIVVIQTDITELKKQSQLISEQYYNFRKVAYMVSHNARAQLTNIIGLCNEVAYQGYGSVDQGSITAYLKESATKLDEVIHSIIHQTSVMKAEQFPGCLQSAEHNKRKVPTPLLVA